MNYFEELGQGLGSLSLRELSANTSFIPEPSDVEDPMEIDSIEDVSSHDLHANRNVSPTKFPYDAASNTILDDTDEEGNSLFLDILSPTAMGVKYALKPRKLLMPAPDTMVLDLSLHQEPTTEPTIALDHDYEFDTSFLTSVPKHTKSLGDTLTRRPTESMFGVPFLGKPLPPVSSFNSLGFSRRGSVVNSMGRPEDHSYQAARSPDSLQIHHHHYYPPQAPEPQAYPRGNMLSQYQRPKESHGVTNRGEIYNFQGAPDIQSLQRRNHHNTVQTTKSEQRTRLQIPEATTQILPSPWDPHAVPAERTPYVLSSYLQLVINMVLSGYAVYIIFAMIHTIQQDVSFKLQQESNNLLVEIALCERAYHENYCSPDTIVPALEKMCAHWEKCMNQDPSRTGNKSLVSAHTIGVILNSLVEPLSFKVLAVGAMAILVVFACNFAFGYIRAKTYYGWTSAMARHH